MRMDYKPDPSGGPVQDVLNGAWGLAAAGQNLEPMLRAAARGNVEVFTLMSRRAQAYVELPVRLSQCRTPQDLANEQMQFWQTMARQYAESSQKLLAAWLEVAQQIHDRSAKGNGERERDYITFPEPEESSSDERRAA